MVKFLTKLKTVLVLAWFSKQKLYFSVLGVFVILLFPPCPGRREGGERGRCKNAPKSKTKTEKTFSENFLVNSFVQKRSGE